MTTYILGAGASRHVGYPLSNSMGSELLAWMRRTPDSPLDYPGTANLLRDTFGQIDNFEELLTQVGSLIQQYEHGSLEERGLRSTIAFARFTLSQGLRDWFTEIRRSDAVAYRDFARDVVQSGDCIIDFNYDVSLDRELKLANKWLPGDGYGFRIDCLPYDSPVNLLKLHGSVNWLAIMAGGARSGAFGLGSGMFGNRPTLATTELEFLGYGDISDPAFPRESAALPVMILPARVKQFFFASNMGAEWAWFWDDLWEQAREALGRSERLVVCGYSLPAADERARELLLTSAPSHARIDVSAGGDSGRIVQEFRQAGYQYAMESEETLFEQWVTRHKALTVKASMESS